MDGKQVEWVITQGIGAVLALAMFLWYRRDVHAALNSWRDQNKTLMTLVQDVSARMQANTDAVQANTEAVQAMERKLPHSCPMADQLANDAVAAAARAALRRV